MGLMPFCGLEGGFRHEYKMLPNSRNGLWTSLAIDIGLLGPIELCQVVEDRSYQSLCLMAITKDEANKCLSRYITLRLAKSSQDMINTRCMSQYTAHVL